MDDRMMSRRPPIVARSRRSFLRRACQTAAAVPVSLLAACAGRTRQTDQPARVSLRAGSASRDVTPPAWVPYLTSSGNGTSAAFKGVHDPLLARALVLDDGNAAAAIVAVDSIGFDNALLGP